MLKPNHWNMMALLTAIAAVGCAGPLEAGDDEDEITQDEQAARGIGIFPDGRLAATDVAMGSDAACALHPSGQVYCWGSNDRGQLGRGTFGGSSSYARVVPTLSGIVGIQAGSGFACALRGSDGVVLCWGRNSHFQLGVSGADRATPVAVTGVANAIHLSVGLSRTCVTLASGAVRCWGLDPLSTPSLTGIVQATPGWIHQCAVDGTGQLWCWGSNWGCQIGNGTETDQPTPYAVPLPRPVVSVAAGGFFTCAALDDGRVFCWGYSDAAVWQDSAGLYRAGNICRPRQVPNLTNIVDLSAGWAHACAQRSDGAMFCWGEDNEGELGIGFDSAWLPPVQVGSLSSVSSVPGGDNGSCAVAAGYAYCWGRNDKGQVGKGTVGGNVLWPAAVLLPPLVLTQ